MNLLYVTPFFRVPPDFGLGTRNFHILNHLAARHSINLVTYGEDETGQTDDWLAERACRVTRIPYAFTWAASESRRESLRRLFDYPPISFRRFDPITLSQVLQRQVRDHDADLILFDTQLTGQALVRQELYKPGVLVLADIYSVNLRRRLSTLGARPSFFLHAVEWFKTQTYERRVVSRFRFLVSVSPKEGKIAARWQPGAEIFESPNGVDTTYFSPAPNGAARSSLVFVGNFDYGPNVDAFFYFCKVILPLIRAVRPDLQFVAVGRNPSAAMKAVAESLEGVSLTGTVADVRPYYARAAVAVVPLRVGSGVKLKTLEAFAMAVPVVSTLIGAEGIAARDGEHFAQADSPHIFAEKVLWLLDRREDAGRLAVKARALVEERYDWKMIALSLEEHLMRVAGPKGHAMRELIAELAHAQDR